MMCVATATLLGACADGYPSGETGGLMLRHGMSVEESIEAMNYLGKSPQLGQRWNYQLQTGCVLAIASGGRLKQRDEAHVSLAASQSTTDKDDDGRNYRVLVRPSPSGQPARADEGVVVLDDTTWNDATQMRWLLDHLRAHCMSPKSSP